MDWSREKMEAYVKHRRYLKAKDVKVKDPLPRPPPSESSVPSAQPVVVSGDDVDLSIARLDQELSTFARQFNDLRSFLRTSFNQLSQDVTAKIAFNPFTPT